MTPEQQEHFDRRFAEAVQRVEKYHSIGREALRLGGGKFTRGVIPPLMEKYGVKESFITRSRKFASEYSEERLYEVIELCREAEFIPGREMFATLATVSKGERAEWEQAMITEGWSIRNLQMEVKDRFGKRNNGCKHHRLPKNLKEADHHVARLRKHWRELSFHFWEATMPSVDSRYAATTPFVLSLDIRRNIKAISKALDELHDQIKAQRLSGEGSTAA